jgi:hypothetical protein
VDSVAIAGAAFVCGALAGAGVMLAAWTVVDRRRVSVLAGLEYRIRKLERGYSA